ncbi:IS110 family RNA-guided transposase [Blastococcus deserti]
MVVTVGIDVHKQTHCAVAVDEGGRQLGRPFTVRATDAGHRQVLRWAAREFEGPVLFAVEDCRHVSGRLERALLDAGQSVVRVPPRLMAQTRTSARTRGKSDPIDALAVARAAVREPSLPHAEHTHASRELKLLVDHREDLVGIRTGMQNRLRWRLHELDPEFDVPDRRLALTKHLDRLQARLEELPESLVRRLALEELADIRDLTGRINAFEREITALVSEQAPQLLTLPGCGPLTAAKLVGETANPVRFRSEACFAMHAGAAPIPASSGKTNRHRLARGGNRQLNAALHRIAVTQIRLPGLGRTYYQRRRSDGDSTMEALRALKRRLARVVFNLLRPTDRTAAAALPQAA